MTHQWTPKCIPKGNKDMSIRVHGSASHEKKWEKFKCPSTDKWTNTTLYMHSRKYCSAIKK